MQKRDNRRDDKGDARKGFRKPVKTNDREIKRDDRRGDRPEKRFDRRGSMQDAVAGKNSVVEALRAKIPAKELVVAIKVELDEKISEAIRLAKNADVESATNLEKISIVAVVTAAAKGDPRDSLIPKPRPTATVYVTPTPTPSTSE